jgi:hypothetical protein
VNVPSLKRATGNWVVGEQFWDRQDELQLFLERIEDGAHLMIVAPRRIGKTSLMKEAARRLGDRYLSLFIDLQQSQGAEDAIVELSLAAHAHAPLWEKTKVLFQNVLARLPLESVKLHELAITLRSGLTSGDWQAKGDELLSLLAGHEKPVLLLIDEVSILVNRLLKGADYQITAERRRETDAFLSWLRANTIRHQGKIRIVVTGSIGLEPLARQAGVSANLNTFAPFHLGPWSRDTTSACLTALANGAGLLFADGAIHHLLDRLGWFIPFHVQLFFDYIYQEARRRKLSTVTADLVAETYNLHMLGVHGHVEMSHMEERLKSVLGPKLDVVALELLTEAAVSGALEKDAAAFLTQQAVDDAWPGVLRDILAVLEHDGYLMRDDERFRFASAFLQDWWKARFQFTYVPISERRRT